MTGPGTTEVAGARSTDRTVVDTTDGRAETNRAGKGTADRVTGTTTDQTTPTVICTATKKPLSSRAEVGLETTATEMGVTGATIIVTGRPGTITGATGIRLPAITGGAGTRATTMMTTTPLPRVASSSSGTAVSQLMECMITCG